MPLQPLQSLADEFVQSQKVEKGKRTHETYGRKINVFQEYLCRHGHDQKSYDSFLHTMNIDQIIATVRYYVETYNIKYKTTTDTYYTAIKVFFDYIHDHHGIQNEYFSVNSRERELKAAYENVIRELKLNSKETVMPINEEQCTMLLSTCDKRLSEVSDDDIIKGGTNGIYSAYISSLISKFVLLFGTRNKLINEINLEDYDRELNKVIINGYSVRLPDGLAMQMRRYYDVRKRIVAECYQQKHLFVDVVQLESALDNGKMFWILNGVLGHKKSKSLSKYAIVQMLRNGIPLDIVKEFTGYSKDICDHCQEIINEERGAFKQIEKDRILNAALRQSVIFDNL